MADLTLLLTGCGGIAVLALALDNTLPPTLRPWWRARARWVLAPRTQRAGQQQDSATAEPPALQLVEAADRRQQRLPFVGRDRRRQAELPVQARRRVGRD